MHFHKQLELCGIDVTISYIYLIALKKALQLNSGGDFLFFLRVTLLTLTPSPIDCFQTEFKTRQIELGWLSCTTEIVGNQFVV